MNPLKRASHLFEQIIADENLARAIREVNRTHHWHGGHKPNRCTIWVERTFPERVKELRAIIEAGFESSPATEKDKYDTNARKWRHISEPRQWPDQYVHHALIQVLEPLFMRNMDPWCAGSIKGRGIQYGKHGIEKWIRHDFKGTRHELTGDILKFYDNLDPERVMDDMRRRIKDHRTLELIWAIIRDGIHAGWYTSQWFANVFLQPLDRLIRESGAAKHYMRYVDNLTIFGPNKRKLRRLKDAIVEWLRDHGLDLKGDWQIFPVRHRLPDALGYRYGRTYTIPRKRKWLKLKRAVAKYRKRRREGRRIPHRLAAGILSRLGSLKYCNNYNFYRTLFRGKRLMKELKQIVRQHTRTLIAWENVI